jgi:mRNA interferase MazF
MPSCEVWDLVKVPYPYTNRPVQQRRPALVVAVPDVPGAPDLLWVLMVTSAANRGWPGDVLISDLDAAGLPAPSLVRPAKIATIEARDAERLGHLSQADRAAVRQALRDSLGRFWAGPAAPQAD